MGTKSATKIPMARALGQLEMVISKFTPSRAVLLGRGKWSVILVIRGTDYGDFGGAACQEIQWKIHHTPYVRSQVKACIYIDLRRTVSASSFTEGRTRVKGF